ncbi:MAG: hypothetical protein PVJ49_06625 [Acidobacteriota bacterium]|jgi:hypothetical protein
MDDEIDAMSQVVRILEELDEEARARVVRWAADRYGVDVGQSVDLDGESGPEHQVRPSSGPDKAETPPPRDPSKPSFMDTSFRMFSGKQQLKKAKDDT